MKSGRVDGEYRVSEARIRISGVFVGEEGLSIGVRMERNGGSQEPETKLMVMLEVEMKVWHMLGRLEMSMSLSSPSSPSSVVVGGSEVVEGGGMNLWVFNRILGAVHRRITGWL